jgi:hypothetical protein
MKTLAPSIGVVVVSGSGISPCTLARTPAFQANNARQRAQWVRAAEILRKGALFAHDSVRLGRRQSQHEVSDAMAKASRRDFAARTKDETAS